MSTHSKKEDVLFDQAKPIKYGYGRKFFAVDSIQSADNFIWRPNNNSLIKSVFACGIDTVTNQWVNVFVRLSANVLNNSLFSNVIPEGADVSLSAAMAFTREFLWQFGVGSNKIEHDVRLIANQLYNVQVEVFPTTVNPVVVKVFIEYETV